MLHNVTVKREENKVLEQYWAMKALQNAFMITCTGFITNEGGKLLETKELEHNPTPQEIAQFLSDSKADFVSAVQNYRFENELPFC